MREQLRLSRVAVRHSASLAVCKQLRSLRSLPVHRLVNNQREVLEFAFSDVFDTEVQQQQVPCSCRYAAERFTVLAALASGNTTSCACQRCVGVQ